MNLFEVEAKLAGRREDLRQFGVKTLSVFGSVAKGTSRSESDVDLLVEFDGPATFDRYIGLKFFLEDTLSCPIDLVTRQGIRPEIRSQLEQDTRRVA